MLSDTKSQQTTIHPQRVTYVAQEEMQERLGTIVTFNLQQPFQYGFSGASTAQSSAFSTAAAVSAASS